MNRFQSLRAMIVSFVMMIMVTAGFLTGFLFVPFQRMGYIQRMIRMSPLTLVLLFLGISFFIGSMLAIFTSKRIIGPLKDLSLATKKMSEGDFSIRVKESSQIGEVNELIHSFNQMAEELGNIELYRKDFINNFSHEFKTPIVSIRGFAKQLKNPELSPKIQQEYVDIIISESEKLANMSGNVLQITRLENQSLVGERTDFRLDDQLRDCVLLFERQWDEKQIEWDLDLPAVTYHGNADLIAQIWQNLINNAIKFSPEGSKIRVALFSQDKQVQILVEDHGCGMDEHTLHHIFEKFYQGDPSHKTGGNGLGLSIVKRIVELSEGKIEVYSAPGLGTRFVVTLPQQ